MARDLAHRIADVRRLQAATREVIRDRPSIVPALVDSTGLTAEGVELALARHLEVEATDAELESLVRRAGDASQITVVLSANVFVGALRALAIARAASETVVVRPSRREPAFARALVHAAQAAGDDAVRLDEDLDVARVTEGEIHVYGRDETIADVREKVRGGRVRVRGHGSGMGVAFVSRLADLELAARALADDVVVFDQRGCLSPRVALVEGTDARADELAERLHTTLEARGLEIPRGPMPSDERAAAGRYIATMTYASKVLEGRDHAVGIGPRGAPLVLPPPWRHVHVAAVTDVAAAKKLLEPLAKGIVTLGSSPGDAEDEIAHLAPSWARRARLGHMQRPPLDGPVDLREG